MYKQQQFMLKKGEYTIFKMFIILFNTLFSLRLCCSAGAGFALWIVNTRWTYLEEKLSLWAFFHNQDSNLIIFQNLFFPLAPKHR